MNLEEKIKDFVHDQGVEVVGLAGPERLNGPPSLDLNYSMPGARSVISMALPMNVDALYDFLAKRSPAPHNLDQFFNYQRLQRIGANVADYLNSMGYRAMGVPLNADPAKKLGVIWDMLKRGLTTGDAAPRFDVLRRLCSILWPPELFEGIPELEDFPEDESERLRILAEFVRRMGVKGIDDYPIPIICGQCALVCGPTLEETAERYRTLADAGLVVPGPGGRMTRVDTFEEARAMRARYPFKASLG